jgi:tetraacyldisaccharide 4'-kinase
MSFLTWLRLWLYQNKVFKKVELPIPVISVGNLTMGGTGKTPFTLWILEHLIEKHNIGVVVRSYKASAQNPTAVKSDSNVMVVGDEALLLKLKVPQAHVYTGPNKSETALKLYQDKKPDLILVDDGFQHFKLKRDLDIVLLDVSVSRADYSWFPLGRLREGFRALQRASVIVLSKTEMKNEKTFAFIKSKLPSGCLVLESEQQTSSLTYEAGQNKYSDYDLTPTQLKEKKIFAFAGLARPVNFKKSLQQRQISVSQFLGFPDHTKYDSADIKNLVQKAKDFDLCITTEKDAVKLRLWPNSATGLYVLPLRLNIKGAIKEFYEKLDQCFR